VTGHLLGGAGSVEAAVAALTICTGLIPPTHNLEDPDPRCDLDHVVGSARVAGVEVAMSNSSAFGGHNVSLVLGPAGTRLRRKRELAGA
jgi:3-oxoacyl-[acyl-carrier-protein] synthase II